jgi:Zn-dependent peptidase ImmA (M78 family)
MSDGKNYVDINKLLNGAFEEPNKDTKDSLRKRFEQKLIELKMLPTHALEILNIEYRALNGILDGTQKRVDFVTLSKLGTLLEISHTELFQLYVKALEENFKDDLSLSEARKFISENFDLITLRKVGFINSITDFNHIEERINSFFGFNSIFEYKKYNIDVAFSSGAIKPKNELTRDFWITTAIASLYKDNNPYPYNKEALIAYFPKIRWHSTDRENGLLNVTKALYKLGVTVIFQPSMPTLHLRGATFAINEKPCIVLTDYRGFYPTLWFALLHELFHVIFDWEEILANQYHLSDEENDIHNLKLKEERANKFARDYLFSKEKMNKISNFINDKEYVKEFAAQNHVDESFIYLFNAFDSGSENKRAWAMAHKNMPDIKKSIEKIGDKEWNDGVPISDIVNIRKKKIFKTI